MMDLLEAPGAYGRERAEVLALPEPPDWLDKLVGKADRVCSRCHTIKPVEEFPIKNKATGLRRVWCRDCGRAYGREHYQKDRPAYLARASQRRATERPKTRRLIDDYLRSHPCVDCGCPGITVLEFDHRDPSQKDLTVGALARVAEWPRVLKEIEKCDVRCANCHRRRTASQFDWAKLSGVVIDSTRVRPGKAGRYARLDDARQDTLLSTEPHGLRRCSRCGDLKALAEFPFRDFQVGARGYYCRRCQAAYRREHYKRNRADYVGRAMTEMRMKRQDALLLLHEYLRAHPCVDCGQADLVVLEFDHVDPATKTIEVAQMIGRRSWPAIQAEIRKCEVRCANCHRRRSARQQGWKARLAESRGRYGKMLLYAGVA